MEEERKAGSLIISQLGMFNEAVSLFNNIVEPAILEAFDKSVESFAHENNWIGTFDLEGDDDDCWLAPSAWNIADLGEKAEHKAWFEIDSINEEDDSWTALFCRQANTGGEAGFVFNVDHKKFNGKNAWNAYAANIDALARANLTITC